MKSLLVLASVFLSVIYSVHAADTTVKLSKVHLCCPSCVKGVDKAIAGVAGAKSECDKDAGTVSITAPDQATAQKAVNAMVAAGYFGTSSDPTIKVENESGAKKGKVESLKISGVHLCCGKCVSGVTEALGKVKGVKGNTAAKGVETFEVTGDFKPKKVFTELNKAGFAGTVSK